MAFEYLCLEVIERGLSFRTLSLDFIKSTALFYELDNEDMCMVDGEFWQNFSKWMVS